METKNYCRIIKLRFFRISLAWAPVNEGIVSEVRINLNWNRIRLCEDGLPELTTPNFLVFRCKSIWERVLLSVARCLAFEKILFENFRLWSSEIRIRVRAEWKIWFSVSDSVEITPNYWLQRNCKIIEKGFILKLISLEQLHEHWSWIYLIHMIEWYPQILKIKSLV